MQNGALKSQPDQPEVRGGDAPVHKPLTLAQNVALTMKVLAIAAILIAALWAFDSLSG